MQRLQKFFRVKQDTMSSRDKGDSSAFFSEGGLGMFVATFKPDDFGLEEWQIKNGMNSLVKDYYPNFRLSPFWRDMLPLFREHHDKTYYMLLSFKPGRCYFYYIQESSIYFSNFKLL